jgi:hypothetical protein
MLIPLFRRPKKMVTAGEVPLDIVRVNWPSKIDMIKIEEVLLTGGPLGEVGGLPFGDEFLGSHAA